MRLFIVLLSSALLWLTNSIFPLSNVYAQVVDNTSLIGPELAGAGYDPNSQKNTALSVIDANGYTGFTQFANDVNGNPYNPAPNVKKVVIRLVSFGYDTPPSTFSEYAKKLLAIQNQFPAGTIVLVGNELNNLDLEYRGTTDLVAAATKYAQQFNALASTIGGNSHFRVAPASPDLYNGNWDPVPWLKAFGAAVDCNNVDVLVANVFQNITPRIPGYTTAAQWLDVYKSLPGYVCGKPVVHFGGLGADPNAKPPLPIDQQVKFLDDFKLPSGIESASTLLIDPCKDSNVTKSDWLFYIPKGGAFDADGVAIDPADSCNRKSQSYIYPGIDSTFYKSGADSALTMASRYMLTCANTYTLDSAILNESDIDKPSFDDGAGNGYVSLGLNCPSGGTNPDSRCLIPKVSGVVKLDNTNATIPLYRLEKPTLGATNLARRSEDLEGFLGAKYTVPEDAKSPSGALLANGPTQKLLGKMQTCQNTLAFLQSIKTLCENEPSPPPILNDPEKYGATVPPTTASKNKKKCALDESVAGTPYTYTSLLSAWGNNSCSNPNPNLDPKILEAFDKIETVTPKAFRPAYLITYTNLPSYDAERDSGSGLSPTSLFAKYTTWFAPDTKFGKETDKTVAMARNRIRISKVYVPANLSVDPQDASSQEMNSTFTSSLLQTLKSIIPHAEQTQIKTRREAEIAGVLTGSQVDNLLNFANLNSANPPSTNVHIGCPECNDTMLESVFVRRINAENMRGDENRFLNQEDNLTCTANDLEGEVGETIKRSLNPGGVPDPVLPVEINTTATLHAKAQKPQSTIKIRTYLLLPEEYRNIYDYESALVDTFSPLTEQIVFSAKKPLVEAVDTKQQFGYKYLQLGESEVTLTAPETRGSSVGYKYSTDATGVRSNTDVSLKGVITGEKPKFNGNAQLPGGKLARGLWEIMCSVTRPFKSGQNTVPYAGFEQFLKKGMSACYDDSPGDIASDKFTGLSAYFKDLFNIQKRWPYAQGAKTCGFTFVDEATADKYVQEFPDFIKALEAGLRKRSLNTSISPLFGECGGKNCADFIGEVVKQVRVCGGDKYVNPYYVMLISLNEGSNVKNADGTGYFFGCQPYAFTNLNETTYQDISCKLKLDDRTGIEAISPIMPSTPLEGNANEDVINACVNPNSTPLGDSRRETLVYEDGLACLIGRLQNACENATNPLVNRVADTYAMLKYGYDATTGENISPTLLKNWNDYVAIAKSEGFTPSFDGACK